MLCKLPCSSYAIILKVTALGISIGFSGSLCVSARGKWKVSCCMGTWGRVQMRHTNVILTMLRFIGTAVSKTTE
jgi:hypothetical protein